MPVICPTCQVAASIAPTDDATQKNPAPSNHCAGRAEHAGSTLHGVVSRILSKPYCAPPEEVVMAGSAPAPEVDGFILGPPLLPVPSAGPEPFLQMRRCRGHHAHRLL